MAKLTLQQTLDTSLKTAKQYIDIELVKKVGTKRSINFVSDHTSNWTSSSAMSGKEYLGGWHGTVPNSGTSGYLSFGASGSSTLDLFIDGDYYAKENKKVYHEGNKPTPADIGASASGHTHNYLPLSGGSLTGQVYMSQSSGDTYYYARRSDTGTSVKFGVGSGGVNHGVYSEVLNKWMVYADASNVYLNGNATTATKVNNNLVVKLNGGSTEGTNLFTFNGSAAKTVNITPSSIGAAASSHGTHVRSTVLTAGYDTAFRTVTKGDNARGSYFSIVRTGEAGISYAPQYGSGIAWGEGDTHGYLTTSYNSAVAYLGAGSADKLNWIKEIAFTDSSITGNAASADKWKTARTLTIGEKGQSVDGTGDVSWTLSDIGAAAGKTASAKTAATAGWYRIASASGKSRTFGTFTIEATVSGRHSVTKIHAGTMYGQNPTLQQISHAPYSLTGISKARIVYHTTNSDNYAYLEVYLPSATATTLNVQMSDYIGWSLTTPSTAGSIPSGYLNKEITFASNKIVSDISGDAASVDGFSFWSGTQAQYDAISSKDSKTVYMITG